MLKIVLAGFIAILSAGVLGGQVTKEIEIAIPVACGGDWKPSHGQGNFHPDQWDPGAMGLIWSGSPGFIEGHGNGPCCFHIIAEVFKKSGGSDKWIQTWIKITWMGNEDIFRVTNGAGMDQGSMSFWYTIPYYPSGDWTFEIDLGVLRNGYADPAGDYTSKVHVNIANMQNGCPPGQYKSGQ